MKLRALLLVPVLLLGGCQGDDERGGTGFGGSGETGGTTGGDEEPPVEGEFAEPHIRILLARQYVNAIAELFDDEIAELAAPRADVTLNGFDAIGAGQLSLTDADIDDYERSATAIAAAALASPTALEPYLDCVPSGPDDVDCLSSFVERFGLRAWRRPLEPMELGRWTNVGFTAALDFGEFERGLEFIIAGMLQSPNFIYQIEVGVETGDGSGRRKLTSYELASRMSLFLTDNIPSAALLAAAGAGELDDEAGVREWAATLLADPRARLAFDEYFEELLYLRKLAEIAKDPATYPGWSPYLAESMKVETIALIDDIVWLQDSDFRDILDAEHTFVNDVLAAHYGVAYPGPAGFQKIPVPPGEKRGGIFGHASLLSVLAHVSSTSPTIRGKFIQERMLCFSIPPPPPEVVTDLPSAEEAPTMRDRLELHLVDPVCASCHQVMDPAGLGLENYDGVGRFRTAENGVTLDTQSELDDVPFDGALELGGVLRDKPEFARCTVLNLYRHGAGHVEAPGELAYLDAVEDAFVEDNDYRLRQTLVDLVASEAFRYVGEQD